MAKHPYYWCIVELAIDESITYNSLALPNVKYFLIRLKA